MAPYFSEVGEVAQDRGTKIDTLGRDHDLHQMRLVCRRGQEDGNSRHAAASGKHMHGNHAGQQSHLGLQDVDTGTGFGLD